MKRPSTDSDSVLTSPIGPLQDDTADRFLDYFNAGLRQRGGFSRGEAAVGEDGIFRATLRTSFPLDDTEVGLPLSWTIERAPDGTIDQLLVEVGETSLSEAKWHRVAEAFVREVLSAALAEDLKQFFIRRPYVYIGAALDGEYWLPGFRVAPAVPDDECPTAVNFERVLYLDLKVDAIDEMHAFQIAEERARKYSARLDLLLGLGLSRPSSEQVWILTDAGEQRRYQRGFADGSTVLPSLPKKGTEGQLGKYEGTVRKLRGLGGRTVKCPQEIRKVLRAVEKGDYRTREAFDGCARLVQVGLVLGRRYPSVQLAFLVGAVEAICQATGDYAGFSDFVRRRTAKSVSDELLDFIYGNVRSAVFHGGQFPLGDYGKLFTELTDSATMASQERGRSGWALLRMAINDWVLSLVPDQASP